MTQFSYGDLSIRYEESGNPQGFPLLLLAPGALNSTVEAWSLAAINPLVSYTEDFRLIAMDQRNAGASRGPLAIDDPWGSFVADQLRLMDHLGIDRFLAMGCCIGGSYALKIAEVAPDRLVAAVLEQPIGLDNNADLWKRGHTNWANALLEKRSDLDATDAEAFGAAMWTRSDFVFSVTPDFVRTCTVPMAVLPGVDQAHPHAIGMEIAELLPGAELIEPWRDDEKVVAAATAQVLEFLRKHVPA